MTTNPEQPVLDAIDELVEWQLEEGRRRGDGPTSAFTPQPGRDRPWIPYREWFAPAPEDAPYRDHVELEPGDRVGWVGPDGVVHVGTVAEHREHPEGSGNWTLTVGDELPPRSPAESTLAWLQRSFPVIGGQQRLPIVGA